MSLPAWLLDARELINRALSDRLTFESLSGEGDPAKPLVEAMRYATLGPGKRLRPALCLAAAQSVKGSIEDAIPAACAVELLHAYTLVHDDLPCMDDDDIRRGRPTVHVEFGEAIALLAGDALLTEAFAATADSPRGAGAATKVLARRAGTRELLAGQARDLAATPSTDFSTLERLHAGKTGALYAAAAELGGISAGASDRQRKALADFGMAAGIAFQHADDKDDGEHAQHQEQAGKRAEELAVEARGLAEKLPDPQPLLRLVPWIAERL